MAFCSEWVDRPTRGLPHRDIAGAQALRAFVCIHAPEMGHRSRLSIAGVCLGIAVEQSRLSSMIVSIPCGCTGTPCPQSTYPVTIESAGHMELRMPCTVISFRVSRSGVVQSVPVRAIPELPNLLLTHELPTGYLRLPIRNPAHLHAAQSRRRCNRLIRWL